MELPLASGTTAGISAAGTFAPGVDVLDPAKPPALLCDPIDPSTGELSSLFAAPHPVDAAIAEAFRLTRATGAAVPDHAQEFRKIRKMGDSVAREIEDEARRVMAPFVAGELVEILGVLVETDAGHQVASAAVRYRNRLTRREERVIL